jgi:hypothetical protein
LDEDEDEREGDAWDNDRDNPQFIPSLRMMSTTSQTIRASEKAAATNKKIATVVAEPTHRPSSRNQSRRRRSRKAKPGSPTARGDVNNLTDIFKAKSKSTHGRSKKSSERNHGGSSISATADKKKRGLSASRPTIFDIHNLPDDDDFGFGHFDMESSCSTFGSTETESEKFA